MSTVYQTLDDGTVQVPDGQGGWSTPWPSDAEIALFNKKIPQWQSLVEAEIERYNEDPANAVKLPSQLGYVILAIMYGEGADPDAVSFDNGIGLMQITDSSLKKRPAEEGGGLYSNEELKDPELNVRIAVEKMIGKEYATMGLDLPQIASGFNGGFVPGRGANRSSEGPWGWREYKIPSTGAHPYISKVVRINNYAIQTLPAYGSGSGSPGSDSGFPWVAMTGAVVGTLGLWVAYRIATGATTPKQIFSLA